MKYLIVSADDFGLSKSVNRGIVKAHQEGIVTAVHMIPAGEAFEDAVELADGLKLEEVGAHLALTETAPLTDVALVPTLVTGTTNRFHKHYAQFLLNFFTGRIDTGQIYTELKSQLDRLEKTGRRITVLSSHEHIHMVPGILEIFIRLKKEYNIPSIRYSYERKMTSPMSLNKMYKRIILSCFAGRTKKALKESGAVYADGLLGFLDSGRLEEETLLGMLGSLGDGTTELVSHPGFLGPEILDRYIFHKNCESELAALTSRRVKKMIIDRGIKLITYGEFAARR